MGEVLFDIFTGNFGSGKTELALNFALKKAREGHRTVLADLDIVNPYFRSHTKAKQLQAAGVYVINSGIPGQAIDVPAVTPEASRLFTGEFEQVVLDVGGDPAGAKILGRYHSELAAFAGKLNCSFVANTARPFTRSADEILVMIEQIEQKARLKINGLINNTNLAEETTADVVRRGHDIVSEVAERSGIPIRYIAGTRNVLSGLAPTICRFFEMEIFMRPDWLCAKFEHRGGSSESN